MNPSHWFSSHPVIQNKRAVSIKLTALFDSGSPIDPEVGTFKLVLELPNFTRQPKIIPPKPVIIKPNPIILVQGWQQLIDSGEVRSKAQLAAKFGLTRARVTQLFDLLDLAPEAIKLVIDIGDPYPSKAPSVRFLRELLKLSGQEQVKKLVNQKNQMRTDQF
jgi:hypothetical protein